MSTPKKRKKRSDESLLDGLIVFAIVLFCFVLLFCYLGWEFLPFSAESLNAFGSLFGGIAGTLIALVAACIVYKTFISQRRAQEKMQIEGHFFELLRMQQNTVSRLSHEQGKDVFQSYISVASTIEKAISGIEQENLCIEEQAKLQALREEHEKMVADYNVDQQQGSLSIDAAIKKLTDIRTKLVEIKKIEKELSETTEVVRWDSRYVARLAYCYTYYGVSDMVASVWDETQKISTEDVKAITAHLQKKGLTYSGAYLQLGVYFRQLYQIVKYVESKSILDESEIIEYMNTIRVQLSIEEQYLLFLNSIVKVGRVWSDSVTKDSSGVITKYNFIRNIPRTFEQLQGIRCEQEYPEVNYEDEEMQKFRVTKNG